MIFPDQSQLELFKKTPGALSVCESVAIMNLANSAPDFGVAMDLGTNAGKAAMSASMGLRPTVNGPRTLVCIDPIFDLENREAWSHSIQEKPENCPWSWAHDPEFREKTTHRIVAASNGLVSPVLLGDYSTNAIQSYETIGWCFVDSDDHAEELINTELALLHTRMVLGGVIAFHDYGNYPAVERAIRNFISGKPYEEIGIDWESIKSFVNTVGGESGNDSWHCTHETHPCHVAAIRRVK